MNYTVYLPIIILFLVLFLTLRSRKRMMMKKTLERKRKGAKSKMVELAKKFIGKECLIYAFDSQIDGVITEVTEGAIMIEKKGKTEILNLDFVIRIREYPKNKKGDKKAVVLD